tara:strand:+ start:228 stop:641 length:414 start_codon:yes stop_codon:yes gene_type:complete
MAILPEMFTPDDVEENPFAAIPEGWYEAELVKSTYETTNDGEGKYFALTFKIIEGERSNRMIFTNLNWVNKSDVAVRIGKGDMKAIVMAVGLPGDYDLEDTDDLHNIPLQIKVSVKPATAQWPEKNEIKGYKALSAD